ncbi:ABC transporter [Methylosinus sp. R-45379]|uniref:ABC transporter ATP-binding protein n=1 Tax=unclassified Methylosinus TaxID=2624500 RepID=UPI0004630748|nr:MULTISPECIES: ABC transporter ATP-binding protein [unclassified Methylosinus]OAI24143.1 ABC transporter [Methylosinus sp. R-45379]
MILRATHLNKSYQDGDRCIDAVSDVDLMVRAGELISIVGRSGSGKSTLLAMIGALTKPTSGDIAIAGERVWELSEKRLADIRRKEIGFIFQFSSMLSNLRAVDNVALPALLGGESAPEEIYARAHDLLTRIGLARRASAFPCQMSGGEQRRVAIARALVNAPRLLLADEPTSDLDEETEEEIIALLEALRAEEGFGMVMVTHNRDLAALADRTLEMRQGVLAPIDARCAEAPRPIRPIILPAPAKHEPPATAVFEGARALQRLGANLWRMVGRGGLVAALFFGVALLSNAGIARYQQFEIEAHRTRLAALEELATSTLRSDIASIASLGGDRFEVTVYLENIKREPPIYVMSPSVRAFIQVGTGWQETTLSPVADATAAVLKVTGRQLYRFMLETRVETFTELLPHYMHVRFTNDMLVSPESTPKDELFQRSDNYFVYLKPKDVADETILRDVRFPGAPPLWIWMPPH